MSFTEKWCNIHWQMHLQIRGVCVGTCVRVCEGESGQKRK